jgi:hypothetical protein
LEAFVGAPNRSRYLAVLLLAAAGCPMPDPSGPPRPLARCTAAQVAALTLEVGPGVEPTFRWTPACGVDWLRVEYPAPDYPTPPGESPPMLLAWARVAGLEPLGPPLLYGAPMPGGFPDFFDPEPLVPGRTYTARLLLEGAEFGTDEEVARTDFVP